MFFRIIKKINNTIYTGNSLTLTPIKQIMVMKKYCVSWATLTPFLIPLSSLSHKSGLLGGQSKTGILFRLRKSQQSRAMCCLALNV